MKYSDSNLIVNVFHVEIVYYIFQRFICYPKAPFFAFISIHSNEMQYAWQMRLKQQSESFQYDISVSTGQMHVHRVCVCMQIKIIHLRSNSKRQVYDIALKLHPFYYI